ncbi:adenine phosphoribosyltransferase 5 [Tanacetum coccineum]
MSLAASNLLIIVVILAYQELELKRGFIFGPPVGMAIGAKICTTAKTKESYTGEVISESYTLEYGTDRQRMHVGAVQPGESVLIVDDLVATGGTLSAAIRLLGKHGITCWKLNCEMCLVVIGLPLVKGNWRLNGVPLYALVEPRLSDEVKAPISTMIVSVSEKDRWCGTRGKFVRWKAVEGRILNKGKAACGVVLRSILGRKTGLEEDENVMFLIVSNHAVPDLPFLGRPWGQQTTATITSARLQRATFPPLSPNGAAGRNEYHRAATPTPLIQGLRS